VPAHAPPLTTWGNFYVIVGSSAGALTGLQFVVIALMPPEMRRGAASASRVFATPTIVHFSSVLVIAAVLSMPRHTRVTLGSSLVGIAAVMLVYVSLIMLRAWRQDVYTPDLEDRLWHFAFPGIAYAGMLVAGVSAYSSDSALYVVAASVLLLLAVGIHNAWDAAVWSLIRRPDP
jgi:hypothetical protein